MSAWPRGEEAFSSERLRSQRVRLVELVGMIGLVGLACVATPGWSAPPNPPSLLDLAHAYRETEREFHTHPPKDAKAKVQVQKGMDRVAFSFFARDFGAAIQGMHVLIVESRPDEASRLDRVLPSLVLEASPDTVTLGELDRFDSSGDPPLTIRARRLYGLDLPNKESVRLELRVAPREQGNTFQVPCPLELEGESPANVETLRDIAAQICRNLPPREQTVDLELVAPSKAVARLFPLHVLSTSLTERVEAFRGRISKITGQPGVDKESLRLVESRLSPLAEESDSDRLNRWVLGTVDHLRELERDLVMLEQGQRPDGNPSGDHWFPFRIQDIDLPCRIYRPRGDRGPSGSADSRPPNALPVVIALHGAGGNEHMFFETLGAGRIKELAERDGFLAVSPATAPLLTHQSIFPALLDRLAASFPIDRDRVYVIGHSMGAFTATQLGSLFPERIAAMALIAGGPRWGLARKQFPRTRVYLPDLDPIVPPQPIRKAVEGCQRAGLPVEAVAIPNCGHVLAVAEVLEPAIEWLVREQVPKGN